MHFEKLSPPTCPSTIFLVSAIVVRHLNLHHPTSTHRRALSTRRPLLSCISSSTSPPLSPPSLVCFHQSMLLFVTFLFFFVVVLFVGSFVEAFNHSWWRDAISGFWFPFGFLAMPALQLSLYSDGCFTRIRLFMEFLCVLNCLEWPWNRPNLLMIFFELLVITIASCSVLLDRIQYCPYFLALFFIIWVMLLGSPPFFHFLDLPLLLSFGSGVVKILPCNIFLYSIGIIKKKMNEINDGVRV